MIESIDDITLTDEYWDCECEKDYIHLRLQESCPICKAESEDQPESRVQEVIKNGFVMFGEETIETKARRLALTWMKDNLNVDEWSFLSDKFELNVYIGDDGNKRVVVF